MNLTRTILFPLVDASLTESTLKSFIEKKRIAIIGNTTTNNKSIPKKDNLLQFSYLKIIRLIFLCEITIQSSRNSY